MSEPIPIRRFCLLFCLYVLISLLIHSTAAFTILAWLIYLITLLPFYLLCVAHVISLWLKRRQGWVQYRKFLIYPIAITQLLVILASPANCYGFNQGRACYSLIQSLFVGESLNSFENTPIHWSVVESIFPINLVFYGIFIILFLAMLRIQPKVQLNPPHD